MTDELETPDFDGEPFPAAQTEDEWPSRGHGWALVLVVIFGIIGFYSLRAGAVAGGVVFLSVAAAALALSAVSIRSELRKFMAYRRRL